MFNKDDSIKAIMQFEGSTFEEATEKYVERKNLPLDAFCGPNKTYPCHDKKQALESIALLNTVKPDGWENILLCVQSRAKRFGITEFSESKIVDWYLRKIEKEKTKNGDKK